MKPYLVDGFIFRFSCSPLHPAAAPNFLQGGGGALRFFCRTGSGFKFGDERWHHFKSPSDVYNLIILYTRHPNYFVAFEEFVR
jgi:hypothetical protein